MLQCFHVLFLALHDWIPLGTLNDVTAVRGANPGPQADCCDLHQPDSLCDRTRRQRRLPDRTYPAWLFWWLWISYGLLFVGELKAWWIPYLFHPEPERAARYQAMFGATHAFLPERNGIRPNTLHLILRVATLITLVILGVLAA